MGVAQVLLRPWCSWLEIIFLPTCQKYTLQKLTILICLSVCANALRAYLSIVVSSQELGN
jgi:hypothetical protein